MTSTFKRRVSIDFDGVLHEYTSHWTSATDVRDGPVPGALEWLESLIADDGFEPMIYSSRSKEDGGIVAMKEWLIDNGMSDESIAALTFPTQKPAAFLTLDDRCMCFTGTFPTLEDIAAFRPWNKP